MLLDPELERGEMEPRPVTNMVPPHKYVNIFSKYFKISDFLSNYYSGLENRY
jgi:hypothetical protein